MWESFADFFRAATGGRTPYPFQRRFAEAAELPHLVRAPTGAGKTATAVLGWLWRRAKRPCDTPRRLLYCLPMRVLVEQSAREAKNWVAALHLDVPVHVLMGGIDTEEWYQHPEKPAILIGTQDMLLSRALNRGYAATRFHWPIDFGLLNNDCLWVFDEPQLMANGVSTSAQLAGFRESLQTFGPCPSVWMSATLEPCWLDTIDFREQAKNLGELRLSNDELTAGELGTRMTARKIVKKALPTTADRNYPRAVAEAVAAAHQPGTRTLIVVNTVDRAKEVFRELPGAFKKAKKALRDPLLIHSRYRPKERGERNDALKETPGEAGRVVVATQVVEAGVDLSARVLFTELAPWASVVQRLGRCHRYGEFTAAGEHGEVFWVDVPGDDKAARPYAAKDLAEAKRYLEDLEGEDVSPQSLEAYRWEGKPVELKFTHAHVIRRRDLLDLFDTAPDLSGNDIDVSRFVRSDDPDTDVQVFWREWSGKPNEASPQRLELCSVPLGKFREFLKDRDPDAFIWDHLEGEWRPLDVKQLRPGLVILLPATAGGYSEQLGWDAGSKAVVTPHPPAEKESEEATDSDPESTRVLPKPLTIVQHTANVCEMLEEILKALPLPELADRLRTASRWHDIGKAHAAFQKGMWGANGALSKTELWAKSGTDGKLNYGRKHFRHELASALAVLQHHPDWAFEVAYLIASHHGRVRLGIRALPGEGPPDEARSEQVRKEWKRDPLSALGVWDMDGFGPVDLGDGRECPKTVLNLTPMQLGGEGSWTARALELLAVWGPFRLAYLESLLRAADVRASRKEAGRA